MKNKTAYNLPAFLSPLDLVTILYILLSGIYICFGAPNLWLHLEIRAGMLAVIVALCCLSAYLPGQRVLLFVKSLYPLLFLGFFYTETSVMKNIIFSNNLDACFFNAEQALWHCQPSICFSKAMDQPWFNEVMNICYFSYYILTGLICITLYFKKPSQSRKGIFIVVLSFYFYYIVFAVLPVVGPQYYIPLSEPESPAPYFFGKIMHYLVTHYEKPTGAFPSSHVALALILSYTASRHLKKLFFITLPFVIGICFATVYLKEHYLVDVIAGMITAPLFFMLSEKIYYRISPAGTSPQAL